MEILSLSEVLDKAIDIQKKYFKETSIYMLIMSIIVGILVFISVFIVGTVGLLSLIPSAVSMANGNGADGFNFTPLIVMGIIIFIIVMAVTLMYYAGLLKVVSEEQLDRSVTSNNMISYSFSKLLKLFGVTIAGTILFSPIVILTVVAIRNIFPNMMEDIKFQIINPLVPFGPPSSGAITLLVLVVIALIVATIYFFTIYVFAVPAAIIEGKGFFRAFTRSRRLVKGNFWTILGCNIAIFLSVFVIRASIISFFSLVVGGIYLIIKLINNNTNFMIYLVQFGNILRWPLTIILNMFVLPISMYMVCVLYYNQRSKKEGYDLEIKLMKVSRERYLENLRKERKKEIEFNVIQPINSDNTNKSGI